MRLRFVVVFALCCLPAGADQFSSKLKLVGTLEYGQTSPHTQYHNPPKYRGFRFKGNKGDSVGVWVHSVNGDPVLWVTDSSFNVVAKNDDATTETTDSHVALVLPGNANPDDNSYFIIVTEYASLDFTFTVTLSRDPRLPPRQQLGPRLKRH